MDLLILLDLNFINSPTPPLEPFAIRCPFPSGLYCLLPLQGKPKPRLWDPSKALRANRMDRVQRMPLPSVMVFAILASGLFVRGAIAHEHHFDEIPEGEFVSPEPLVRNTILLVR